MSDTSGRHSAEHAGARKRLQAALSKTLGQHGYWPGAPGPSAFATAAAVLALRASPDEAAREAVARGKSWLETHANQTGGWSHAAGGPGCLETTLLALAALQGQTSDPAAPMCETARTWIVSQVGSEDATEILHAVRERVSGSVARSSVTVGLAIAGRAFPTREVDAWHAVSPLSGMVGVLPGGLTLFCQGDSPQERPLRLAAALARQQQENTTAGPWRSLTNRKALKHLASLQGQAGSFYASPVLTALIAACLTTAALENAPIVVAAHRFLLAQQRTDGGWAEVPGSSVWLTAAASETHRDQLDTAQRRRLLCWLLGRQSGAGQPGSPGPAGGWARSHLAEDLPEAATTAAVLAALHKLGAAEASHARQGAILGNRWLLGLQQGNGGLPPCYGAARDSPWGACCPVATAQARLAWHLWRPQMPPGIAKRLDAAMTNAARFLEKAQRSDGSWLGHDFGHPETSGGRNPVAGTASVLRALAKGPPSVSIKPAEEHARSFLNSVQRPEGAWGGDSGLPPSVEETALAATALSASPAHGDQTAAHKGLEWLQIQLAKKETLSASPICCTPDGHLYAEHALPAILALEGFQAARQKSMVKAAQKNRTV